MGFKQVKHQVIECILEGRVLHEERDSEKNLYAIGDVSDKEVIEIIKYCSGNCYKSGKHHFLDVEVHILKPIGKYKGYYLKFYFIDPDVWFISVHFD